MLNVNGADEEERRCVAPMVVCGVAVTLYVVSGFLLGQAAFKAFKHSAIVGVVGLGVLLSGFSVLVAAYRSSADWSSTRRRLHSIGVVALVVAVANAVVLLSAAILLVAVAL